MGKAGRGRVTSSQALFGPYWGAAHWTSGTRCLCLYLRAQGGLVSAPGNALTRRFRLLSDWVRLGSAPFTSLGRLPQCPIRPGSTPEKTPPPPISSSPGRPFTRSPAPLRSSPAPPRALQRLDGVSRWPTCGVLRIGPT